MVIRKSLDPKICGMSVVVVFLFFVFLFVCVCDDTYGKGLSNSNNKGRKL